MSPADEFVAQPESQGTPPGKENLESADEVYIPDYVMLDFSTPKQLVVLTGSRGSDIESQLRT